jgi:proteasome lid subunit RPN8/RPN11
MKKKHATAPVESQEASVVFSTEVLRRIRRHARSSMSAEICGVLIGEIGPQSTHVDALIEGEAAQQGGTHVTFTQDTWAHIYQVKDSTYPDKRIVGWYHSHPGFGVFLSDHDTFIQRNFFSDARQVAWVYDPHSDEEGCFAWKGQEIVRLAHIALRDEAPSGQDPSVRDPSVQEKNHAESVLELGEPSTTSAAGGRAAVKWSLLVLSYLLAALLGFSAAMLLVPRVIIMPSGFDGPTTPGAPNK